MKRSILLLSGLDHDFGHDFGHDLSRDLGAHGRDLVHSATPSIAMNTALPSAAVDAIPDATSPTPSTTMDAASSLVHALDRCGRASFTLSTAVDTEDCGPPRRRPPPR